MEVGVNRITQRRRNGVIAGGIIVAAVIGGAVLAGGANLRDGSGSRSGSRLSLSSAGAVSFAVSPKFQGPHPPALNRSAAALPAAVHDPIRVKRPAPSSSGAGGLPSAVITTADMSIRLKSRTVLGALNQVNTFVSRPGVGGYVSNSSSYDNNRFLDVEIRVPEAHFSYAWNWLGTSFPGERVTGESITRQDVSLQSVDLHARLANLEAQRAQLLQLFDRAKTVAATIRVQNVLSNVQGQIEQTQGQINYLNGRTSLATITLEFKAKQRQPLHKRKNRDAGVTILDAFGSAGSGIVGVIAGAIIVVGYALPLSLLGLALYALALLGMRFVRRRRLLSPAAA